MKVIIAQNLSITIVSKILSFGLFIYIARVLSEEFYGNYVYITMILSLLPLLQFGVMQGTTILLPKYIANAEKNEDNLFAYSNYISHSLQLIAVGFLFLFDIGLSSAYILIVGANFFLSISVQNSKIYLNSYHKFKKTNIIKALEQILSPISVLVLFYHFHDIESIFLGQLFSTIIAFLVSIYLVPFTFVKVKLNKFTDIAKNVYKLGFFIYLISGVDIIFRTVDRWFISQFYSLENLADYGFTSNMAMNIWLLTMSFISPYVQILYKHLAKNKYIEAKELIESTNKKIYFLLAITSLVAFLIYPYLIEHVVHKYLETYLLFFVLVIVSILLAINNMYIYFMISSNSHSVLLKFQSAILILNLILNSFFSYFRLEIVYFGLSTILSLIIYYVMVRSFFYADIEKKINSL